MKQKSCANWNVAVTHFLTSAFLTNIFAVILIVVISDLIPRGNPYTVFVLVVSVIAVWLGVFMSSKYVNKKYIINNDIAIANFAIIYSLVFFAVFSFISSDNTIFSLMRLFAVAMIEWPFTNLTNLEIWMQIIRAIIIIVLFYIFSRKYIKNTV